MYEENVEPLPPGDAMQVFAPVLAELQTNFGFRKPPPVSQKNVLFWADKPIQKFLLPISRRLLLPGSGISGIKSLEELGALADQGRSCIICLNHRSNLDVPTICTLLQDQSRKELFDKIIWVAGRKLQEDLGLTGILVQAFNRVVVTPKSWTLGDHSKIEEHQAHLINVAAHRVIHNLRQLGWVFALFPTGTRIRPGDKTTRQAIPEIDSYLKTFDFLLLGYIDGCTLPVSRDHDLTHEKPQLGQVRVKFGNVLDTVQWRRQATERFPDLDQRSASALAIMEDISNVGQTENQADETCRK